MIRCVLNKPPGEQNLFGRVKTKELKLLPNFLKLLCLFCLKTTESKHFISHNYHYNMLRKIKHGTNKNEPLKYEISFLFSVLQRPSTPYKPSGQEVT